MPSPASAFLKSIFFSLAYLLVRIQHIIRYSIQNMYRLTLYAVGKDPVIRRLSVVMFFGESEVTRGVLVAGRFGSFNHCVVQGSAGK